MPCNAIATQTARVNLNPALILDNPAAITAVQQMLARLLGIQPQAVTMYNDTHTWGAGWSQWSRNRTVQQPTPVDQLAGGQYIDWVCDKCGIRLTNNGEISLRDGWDLSRKHVTNPDQFLTQVGAVLNQVTGILFQNQVRATIAARYGIAEEQRAPNGALVLTVDL